MATIEEYKRKLKRAVDLLDSMSVARSEAKANVLFYEAIQGGILKAISANVGDKDGHEPLEQIIEESEALWGAELRSVVCRRDEAEEYLHECESLQENAHISMKQAERERINALEKA